MSDTKITVFKEGKWQRVNKSELSQQDSESSGHDIGPLLVESDISNWSGLAGRIKAESDPIASFLQWKLPEACGQILSVPSELGSPRGRRILLSGLNTVLFREDLATAESLEKLEMSSETRRLLETHDGSQRIRLNLLLLQDAFPSELTFAPFLGPRSFERSHEFRFFGRESESQQFALRIMNNPEVLLFAPSGAGKTSLIEAKLVPLLKREGCDVMPIGRMQGPEIESHVLDESANPFVLYTLLSWAGKKGDLNKLAKLTLSEFLSQQDRKDDEPRPRIVILDQFEEFFTLHDKHWKKRREFFEQLAVALKQDHKLRVVFSMRSDFVGRMKSYSQMLPSRLPIQLELNRLKESAALQAIEKPLLQTRRYFAPKVAQELVNRLRTVSIKEKDGKVEEIVEEFVEPVQLQVVCQGFWEALPDDVDEIGMKHIEEFASVDNALMRFYEKCIKEAVEEIHVKEGVLRNWFADQLITPIKTRGLVLRGEKKTGNISNRVVDHLENMFIIRSELRGRERWYELAHDRFIEAILKSNELRLEKASASAWREFQQLRKRASKWNKTKEESLLLNRIGLQKAEQTVTTLTAQGGLEIDDVTKSFIKESRRAKEDAERKQKAEFEKARTEAAVQKAEFEKARKEAAEQKAEAEKIRAHAQEQKARRLGIFLLIAVIAIVYGIISVWAIGNQNSLLENQKKELQTKSDLLVARTEKATAVLVDLEVGEGMRLIEKQDMFASLLWFERAMQHEDPEDHETHRVRYGNVLRSLPVLKKLWIFPAPVHQCEFAADFQKIVTRSEEVVQVSDATTDDQRVVSVQQNASGIATLGPFGRQLLVIDHGIPLIKDVESDKKAIELKTNPNEFIELARFSPDGKRILIISTDSFRYTKFLTLCDSETGNRLIHKSFAESFDFPSIPAGAEFSSTGRQFLTWGLGKFAILWDLEDLNNATELSHGARDLFACFSKDGERVATVGEDSHTRIWESNGKQVGQPMANEGLHSRAMFDPLGRYLIVYGHGDAVEIWKPPTQILESKLIRTLHHNAPLNHVAIRDDGNVFATCSKDATARLWEVNWDGFQADVFALHSLKHENDVYKSVFSPDGRHIATAGRDKTVRVWDVITGELTTAPLRHRGGVTEIQFDQDGSRLLTASGTARTSDNSGRTGEVRLWELQSANPPPLFVSHSGTVVVATLGTKGERVVTAGTDGLARIWDTQSGTLEAGPFDHGSPIVFASLSGNQAKLLTCSTDSNVKIHSINAAGDDPVSFAHDGRVYFGIFDPDGKRFVTFSENRERMVGEIRIYDLSRGEAVEQVSTAGSLNFACFSDDGSHLAVAVSEEIWIWDGSTWIVKDKSNLRHDGHVTFLAFSRDGDKLVSAGTDDAARVWDVASKQMINQPLIHDLDVVDVSFSPVDSEQVVTASDDGTARIWNMRNGSSEWRAIQLRHDRAVTSAAFSPDGKWVVTTDADQIARIWEVESGKPISPPLKHISHVSSTTILKDSSGLSLVTVGFDNQTMYGEIATQKQLPVSIPESFETDAAPFVYKYEDQAISYHQHSSQLVEIRRWPILTGQQNNLQRFASMLASQQLDLDGDLTVVGTDDLKEAWESHASDYHSLVTSGDRYTNLARKSTIGECVIVSRLDAAIFHLEDLIESSPKDWQLFALRCEINLAKGLKEKAHEDFNNARELANNNEGFQQWIEEQLHGYEINGLWGRAAFFLDRLIEANPDWELHARRCRARVMLSRLSFAERDFDKVLKYSDVDQLVEWANEQVTWCELYGNQESQFFFLDRLAKLQSEKWEIYERRARSNAVYGDFESALDDYNQAITLNESDWRLFAGRAYAYAMLSDDEQAIVNYDEAIRLQPDNWWLYSCKAWVRAASFDDEQLPLAIEDYSRAIDLNGSKWQLYEARSELYAQTGETTRQLDDLQAAARIQSDQQPWLLDRLAFISAQNEDWDRAAQAYETAIGLSDGDNIESRRSLARVYLATKDVEKFRDICSQMLDVQMDMDQLTDANNIAWTCSLIPNGVDEPSKMVSLAEMAVSQDSQQWNYLNTLGAALYRNGEFEESIKRLHESTSLRDQANARDEDAVWDWIFLSMAYSDSGDKDEARKWYDKAEQWITENVVKDTPASQYISWDIRVELLTLHEEIQKKFESRN